MSASPILFCLSLHRERFGVFELEPVGRSAGPIARAQALRDNPLQTDLAGVLEDRQAAVMRQVFQAHAGVALAQDARQRRLPDLDRLPT